MTDAAADRMTHIVKVMPQMFRGRCPARRGGVDQAYSMCGWTDENRTTWEEARTDVANHLLDETAHTRSELVAALRDSAESIEELQWRYSQVEGYERVTHRG